MDIVTRGVVGALLAQSTARKEEMRLALAAGFLASLLLPLSDARIAWNIIAVIDPAFSLLLIVALIWASRQRRQDFARYGLLPGLGYLSLGVVQHQRAEAAAIELAASRGHQVERVEVKPTMGNLLLWRSGYQHQGRFYADGVRPGLMATRLYPGSSIRRFAAGDLPQLKAGSVLAADIVRFDLFLQRHDTSPQVRSLFIAMLPGEELPPAI